MGPGGDEAGCEEVGCDRFSCRNAVSLLHEYHLIEL
jgi:hypothetical protein